MVDLLKKLKSGGLLALVLVSTLGLGACGYQLRGTTKTHSEPIKANHSVRLTTTNVPFVQILTKRLTQLGVDVYQDHTDVHQSTQNHIRIQNLKIQSYKLVGVLTEIRTVLSADVSYHIDDKAHHANVQLTRSYQYNEAGVSTTDVQAAQVQMWLYDNLATRISEQYHALRQNR